VNARAAKIKNTVTEGKTGMEKGKKELSAHFQCLVIIHNE